MMQESDEKPALSNQEEAPAIPDVLSISSKANTQQPHGDQNGSQSMLMLQQQHQQQQQQQQQLASMSNSQTPQTIGIYSFKHSPSSRFMKLKAHASFVLCQTYQTFYIMNIYA